MQCARQHTVNDVIGALEKNFTEKMYFCAKALAY
jgi:hypothetical protein